MYDHGRRESEWGTVLGGDHRGRLRAAWSSFTSTAPGTKDLHFCLTSALSCKILARCDGFLGLSWTGSWGFNHGASQLGFVGL